MRTKIIAGNLAAVAFVGLVSYLVARSEIGAKLDARVDSALESSSVLFERSWALSGIRFVDRVREQALSRPMRRIFSGLDRESRRKLAFSAIEALEVAFADHQQGRGRSPDIVVVFDDTGRVVARNKDINRMYDEALDGELALVSEALRKKRSAVDVWYKKDEQKVFQTAVAPITSEGGGILGGLAVGYDISNGLASREARLLGCDVAFLFNGEVYSSSLDAGEASALRQQLFTTSQKVPSARYGSIWTVSLAGDDYVGTVARLPKAKSMRVDYLLLGNRSDAEDPLQALLVILLMTTLGMVFVAVYGSILGSYFIRTIERIEEGVLTIINGKTDHRLDIESPEFGGLAYRINQLVNVVTGVNEEDDEGRVSRPSHPASNWSGGSAAQGASASSQEQALDERQQ